MCSVGVPIDFRWRSCQTGQHIAAAAGFLLDEIMAPPGRLKNPYALAMAKKEFEGRLKLAEAGELKPIDHVKAIHRDPHVDMFEIRWSGVTVSERQGATVRHLDLEVRLYYVDLPGVLAVLGLHGHEKALEGDVVDLQNREIDRAILVWGRDLDRCWGVPELASYQL